MNHDSSDESSKEHLCFLPAYLKYDAGMLSWEQYLHHALLHFVGKRHAQDYLFWTHNPDAMQLWHKDPFGFILYVGHKTEREGNTQHNLVRPEDTTIAYDIQGISRHYFPCESLPCHLHTILINMIDLEAVFQAYGGDSIADLEAKLSKLPQITAGFLQRSLALLALRQRKLDFLQFCLQHGDPGVIDAWPSHAFEDAANAVNNEAEPRLWKIIHHSNWRKHNPWRAPGARDERGE